MSLVVECHFCGQQKDKTCSQGFVAKCCIKRCSKYYCLDCIQRFFNSGFQENNYRKDTWICYFCQDVCNCFRCKNQELDRKPSRRRTTKQSKNNQESVDLQSVSNISLSVNNNSKVVEPTIQVQEKIDIEEEEGIEQMPIFPASVHEQMMIPSDQIILLPPFLKRIAERKNFYFQFMANTYRKEGNSNIKHESKVNSQIKRLITNALNQRKDNSDQIDIQLQ